MPTKRPSKRSLINAARREYGKVKRAYHAAGKKAFGKPANSKVKKEYRAIKRVYQTVGRKLGKLTGVR